MFVRFFLVIMMAAFAFPVAGIAEVPERPSFYKDVLPVMQENCQECHRPKGANLMGMVAPMSFTSYKEVRPWAKAISKQVEARTMPPWHATEEFHGVFDNERTLTQDEIDTIVKWVAQGAPRGNANDSPDPIEFKGEEGWAMGKPDLVIPFDDPYFVPDHAEDLYHTESVRLTKEMLPEDKWIKSMEFKPDSEAVHHIVIFTDDYRESLGFPMGMLGGTGPGTDASEFPDGYGRIIEQGTTIQFNMHYHKESGPGTGVWDQSAIGLTFHDKPVEHEVSWGAIGTMGFRIPAGATRHKVTAQQRFSTDTTILAMFPHMHLRGAGAKYTAHYPDGTEEVLLDVPNYDFNWQTNYIFKEPKKIPAGTTVKVDMWFNNNEAQAELSGINPNRSVGFGQPTTDEMMYGWIDYTETD
jgi:mono/diheme cytochrome c family protein